MFFQIFLLRRCHSFSPEVQFLGLIRLVFPTTCSLLGQKIIKKCVTSTLVSCVFLSLNLRKVDLG